MPLTKQELIERCDSFIERYKNEENMKDVVTITVTMYISLASVFEDVSVEESIELMQSYLGKLKDISDKFENVKDEEKRKLKENFPMKDKKVILVEDLTRYHNSLIKGSVGFVIGKATQSKHTGYNSRFVKVKFNEITIDVLLKGLEVNK